MLKSLKCSKVINYRESKGLEKSQNKKTSGGMFPRITVYTLFGLSNWRYFYFFIIINLDERITKEN